MRTKPEDLAPPSHLGEPQPGGVERRDGEYMYTDVQTISARTLSLQTQLLSSLVLRDYVECITITRVELSYFVFMIVLVCRNSQRQARPLRTCQTRQSTRRLLRNNSLATSPSSSTNTEVTHIRTHLSLRQPLSTQAVFTPESGYYRLSFYFLIQSIHVRHTLLHNTQWLGYTQGYKRSS